MSNGEFGKLTVSGPEDLLKMLSAQLTREDRQCRLYAGLGLRSSPLG